MSGSRVRQFLSKRGKTLKGDLTAPAIETARKNTSSVKKTPTGAAAEAVKEGFTSTGMMEKLQPWRWNNNRLNVVIEEQGLPESILKGKLDENAWRDVERVQLELEPTSEKMLSSLRRRAEATGSVYDRKAYDTMLSKIQGGMSVYKETLAAGKEKANEYRSQAEALEDRNRQIETELLSRAGMTADMQELLEKTGRLESASGLRDEYARNETQLERLRREIERAEGYYYQYIPYADDYEEYSQPENMKAPDYMEYMGSLGTIEDIFTGPDAREEDARVYSYINNIDGFADQVKSFYDRQAAYAGMEGDEQGPYAKYDYMTEYERGIYNYIHAKEGREAADEYLSSLEASLNARQGQGIYENLSGIEKAFTPIAAGLDQFISGARQLMKEEPLEVSPVQYTSSLVRQEAEEKSPILGGLYDLGSSIANMAPSILASAVLGPAVGGAAAGAAGSAVLGSSAAGNAYGEARRNGYTESQAKNYATLVGASEAGLQYVLGGIRSLGGVSAGKLASKIAGIDNALARIAANTAQNMAFEGLEEGLQEILEPAFASLIMGEDYSVNFNDVAYSFLLGALSAGLLEGVSDPRGGRTVRNSFDPNMEGYKGENGTDYFEGCDTIEDIEARYRDLAKENHPDVGGDVDVMADINRQHDMKSAFYEGQQSVREAAPAEDAANVKPENVAQDETITMPATPAFSGGGETVQVVQRLRENIPNLVSRAPVSTVDTSALNTIEGRTMADKARRLFESIKGIVSRKDLGDIEINNRSVKDDLSHGVGAAKAAVIPAIPDVLKYGQQIDFQQNWKGRPYDGYIFAAPVTMDGEPIYVAAVVKRTSKNRFYLHEVVDSNGNIIKIDNGERTNPTSLAANGDAGAQTPLSNNNIPQGGTAVNTAAEETILPTLGERTDTNGDSVSNRGQRRVSGEGAGEQTGGLVQGAGRAAQALEQSRTASERRSRVNALRQERISSKELGIPKGTDSRVIQTVPEEVWDGAMRSTAERVYQEAGVPTTYVIGGIQIDAPDGARIVRGAYTGDRIYIQADNVRLSIDQIADHEIFHAAAARTPGLLLEVETRIKERYDKAEFDRVFNTYAEKLRGVIQVADDASGEAVDAAAWEILEEIYADAYAGINAFGAHAERFQEAVRGAMLEQGYGRQNAAATDRITGPPARYSLNEHFEDAYDNWINNYPDAAVSLYVGDTSEALQSIGVPVSRITWDTKKIQKIKRDHPGMTDAVLKQVPTIIENPILIMQSKSSDSRLTMFGTVTDESGTPVLAVLELHPKNRNGIELNDLKIASAYGKDRAQGLIDSSKILYVDPNKKRTDRWLRDNRLQLPFSSTIYGSIHSISQNSEESNTRFSYGGRNAARADSESLAEAENLEMQGVDAETIRQETGWFRGMDGQWRFEIDDSGMTYSRRGDLGFGERNPEYARYRELLNKAEESMLFDGEPLTQAEQAELDDLRETWGDVFRQDGRVGPDANETYRLSDYIRHEALFENYPQLRDMTLRFADLDGERGYFNGDEIVLDESQRHLPEDTLVHEIQHAIQRYEGFSSGASPEYWASTGSEDANGNYRNTAGEIEARDAARRRQFTAEQRRATPPARGDENTVFADVENSLNMLDAEYGPQISDNLEAVDTREGITQVASMEPVISLTGDEFKKGSTDLITQVETFFAEHGNRAYNSQLGEVILDRRGVKSDIGHGIGRKKAAAFAAVPKVIEDGLVVDYQQNWKGRGYDTAVIAAPVTMDGQPYLEGVVLIRSGLTNRFYLHEVLTENDGATPFKTGAQVGEPGGDTPSIINILERIKNVKYDNGNVPAPATAREAVEGYEKATGRSLGEPPARFSVEDDVEDVPEMTLPTLEEPEPSSRMDEFTRKLLETTGYTTVDEYTAAVEARAAQEREAMMKGVSRDKFVGTPALQKLGVKVENSVGNYHNIQQLIADDKAAREVKKATRQAERRLNATAGERNYASGIVAGVYSIDSIPKDMNRDTVEELVDYYWAEGAASSDLIRQRRAEINRGLSEQMDRLFEDSDQFKVPRMTVLNYRTPERLMRGIFKDQRGGEINAAIFDPVNANEAERIRFVNRMYDEVRTFKDSSGRQRRLNKAERALTQQVIEGRAVGEIVAGMEMSEAIKNAGENIRNGEDVADAAREFGLGESQRRLAVKYARWLETQEMLKSGNVDAVKVENAAKKYSELFNDFYDAINDFLVAHGYEPIGFIKGYAPHLQPETNQNLLIRALNTMGINTNVTQLPSSIAGITANFKPNKRWNPYFLTRTSDITQYDIASAFESYVDYMSDVLYHTDDIMRVRQAANYFRRTYAPENIRENLSWAEGLRYGSTEEKAAFLRDNDALSSGSSLAPQDIDRAMDEYVDKLYSDIKNTAKYSNLVMYLDNYANILAGKQSMADRGREYTGGREALNVGNKVLGWFQRAQVAGNISSALNQSAQLPQIFAELGVRDTAQALWDIATGKTRKAAWAGESDFLTGKRGIDFIVTEPGQMIVTGMFKPLEWVDGFISTLAVRGQYIKEIRAGKTPQKAMRAADKFGRQIMGSRTKGSRPLAFESKKLTSKMLNMFQLEALNSWDHLVSDLPADFRRIQAERGKGAAARSLAGVIVKSLIAAFLLNRTAEELYGGTPAPMDILGLSANFIASGEKLTTNDWLETVIDNGWERLTGERLFETDPTALEGEFDLGAAFEDLSYNVSNDIPFIRNLAGLLGWGDETLPIPDVVGTISEMVSAGKNSGIVSDEMLSALISGLGEMIPGGRQLVKTSQGLETMLRGGRYYGYGDKERLQYPVDGTFSDWVQAMMFGNSALEDTDRFYASGISGLSANQTALYNELVDAGADEREIYQAIQDWRAVHNDDELTSLDRGQLERDVIRSMDISDQQKLRAYEGLYPTATARAEDFRALMGAGMSWDQVMDAYDEWAALNADETMKAGQKATEYAKWLDDNMPSKAEDVKEHFKFYSQIPAEAGSYDTFTESGLDSDTSYELSEILSGLQPENGADQVSQSQKLQAIFDAGLSDSDMRAAAGTIMGSSLETEDGDPTQYALFLDALDSGYSTDDWMELKEAGLMTASSYSKVKTAGEYGVTAEQYIEFKQRISDADANNSDAGKRNGSIDQGEAENGIRNMEGLTDRQRAALWQLQNKQWKPYNNPFDVSVGQWVHDLLNGEDDVAELTLPTP